MLIFWRNTKDIVWEINVWRKGEKISTCERRWGQMDFESCLRHFYRSLCWHLYPHYSSSATSHFLTASAHCFHISHVCSFKFAFWDKWSWFSTFVTLKNCLDRSDVRSRIFLESPQLCEVSRGQERHVINPLVFSLGFSIKSKTQLNNISSDVDSLLVRSVIIVQHCIGNIFGHCPLSVRLSPY